MSIPADRKYTKDHEWAQVSGDAAVVGITEFAQAELGELVFVELPEIGKQVEKGASLCVVESTKAASDVYSPLSGTVVEVNAALKDNPQQVNSAPYAEGWMVKISGVKADEVSALMGSEEYSKLIG